MQIHETGNPFPLGHDVTVGDVIRHLVLGYLQHPQARIEETQTVAANGNKPVRVVVSRTVNGRVWRFEVTGKAGEIEPVIRLADFCRQMEKYDKGSDFREDYARHPSTFHPIDLLKNLPVSGVLRAVGASLLPNAPGDYFYLRFITYELSDLPLEQLTVLLHVQVDLGIPLQQLVEMKNGELAIHAPLGQPLSRTELKALITRARNGEDFFRIVAQEANA